MNPRPRRAQQRVLPLSHTWDKGLSYNLVPAENEWNTTFGGPVLSPAHIPTISKLSRPHFAKNIIASLARFYCARLTYCVHRPLWIHMGLCCTWRCTSFWHSGAGDDWKELPPSNAINRNIGSPTGAKPTFELAGIYLGLFQIYAWTESNLKTYWANHAGVVWRLSAWTIWRHTNNQSG